MSTDVTTSKSLKQLRPHFANECFVSPSWIACSSFAIRRAADDKRSAEVVFASLETSEPRQHVKTDADMDAVLNADRSVTYRWTAVSLDVSDLGTARLFVADGGQTAAINERYVKLFDLYEVRGAEATVGEWNDTVRIAHGNLAVIDAGSGDATVVVMPVRVPEVLAEELRKFDMAARPGTDAQGTV